MLNVPIHSFCEIKSNTLLRCEDLLNENNTFLFLTS